MRLPSQCKLHYNNIFLTSLKACKSNKRLISLREYPYVEKTDKYRWFLLVIPGSRPVTFAVFLFEKQAQILHPWMSPADSE